MYYRKISLPRNPFHCSNSIADSIESFKHESFFKPHDKGQYYSVLPISRLSNELIDIFKKINLTPKIIFLFSDSSMPYYADTKRRRIHSDIEYNEIRESWDNINFGVNWEIEK